MQKTHGVIPQVEMLRRNNIYLGTLEALFYGGLRGFDALIIARPKRLNANITQKTYNPMPKVSKYSLTYTAFVFPNLYKS